MKKKKKVGLIILAVIVIIIAAIVITIAAKASVNVKAMNNAVDTAVNAYAEKYELTEIDCGEYKNLTVYGIMKFNVKQYEVNGLGNLSVMTVNMGVMQMATVVLTPYEKDIPLISADYMYMLGNRTAYLEFYDTVTNKDSEEYSSILASLTDVKNKYSDLADVVPTAAWYDALKTVGIYKSAKAADDETLNQILVDGIGTIMSYSENLPVLEGEEREYKASLQKEYSNGLIENGGVSTDVFVNQLGKEETQIFFDKVLFCTGASAETSEEDTAE